MESIDHFPAGEELWEAEAQGKLKEYQRDVFKKPRPAEELFNVSKDPNQYVNLVNSQECQDVLKHLRKVMDQWIDQTGDTVPNNPSNSSKITYSKDNIPQMEFKRGGFPGAEKNAIKINHPGPVYEKDITFK
jgi:arylsulfatase